MRSLLPEDRRSKFILLGKYFSIIVFSVGDVSIYLHFSILKELLAYCDPYTFVLTSSIAKTVFKNENSKNFGQKILSGHKM